jgi:hypothetical protein
VTSSRFRHILLNVTSCSQGSTSLPPGCDDSHAANDDHSTCSTGREATRICSLLSIKKTFCLALVFLITIVCAACSENNLGAGVTYKPEFLPVHLSLDSSGVSVGGDTSFVTPIGTFSIGASYQLLPAYNGIYVILRNRKTGFDQIFEIRNVGDQFSAVVNGITSIDVSNGRILIDVTAGNIKEVTFKRASSEIPKQSTPSWLHSITARWDAGWQQSWYKPFVLTRWAYDDSTMGRWYGIGFIWFLIRLILTIVLFIIDAILSLGFLLGQIGFLFFGPTGRNVIYGILVLIAIIPVLIGLAVVIADRFNLLL